MRLVWINLLLWLPILHGYFVPRALLSLHHQRTSHRRCRPLLSRLHQTSSSSESEVTETPLSDLDSRVLESMLMDSKLDLTTEEDVRKLLERGTVKTTTTKRSNDSRTDNDNNSMFSSQALKTLSDTKLWKKISVQASDVFESLSIWARNKVERDVAVLAALGLFAWERAVRDVARALPEAGTTNLPKVFLLSNSSSYQEPAIQQPRSVMEEMNRPADEIKAVTRTILDILSGETTRQGPRTLRTVAPAGTGGVSQRVNRAYKQRQRINRQQRDFTRIPGNVVDTAWELRKELKAESSKPGYKTENVRKAIQAGVAGTSNLLRSVKEEARLAAAKRKELRLKAVQEEKQVQKDTLLQDLKDEKKQVLERLRSCISNPEETWLQQEDILASPDIISFDQEKLRDVVMTMILTRNEIESQEDREDASIDEIMEDMRSLRMSLEQLRARTAESISFSVADALWEELTGTKGDEGLILQLDEVDEEIRVLDTPPSEEELLDEEEEELLDGPSAFFIDDLEEASSFIADAEVISDFVDVVPESVEATFETPRETVFVQADVEGVEAGLVAELVTDDDFNVAVGPKRIATAVGEDDDEEKEDNWEENPVAQVTLRILDIVFFALEKTFTVVIPKTILIGETVTKRWLEVQRSGQGTSGWKRVGSAADARGRY